MSAVTLDQPIQYPGWLDTCTNGPGISAQNVMDAAGEYYAVIFQATEDMVISHVAWRADTAVGSPTIDIRIETVDTSTGLPTGTLWAANTNIVTGALSTDTDYIDALTASASISAGDFYAVKFAYNSGTSITIASVSRINENVYNLPGDVINTGTPAQSQQGCPILALGSNATTFYKLHKICLPVNAISNNGHNNASSPLSRGLRFRLPFAARLVGLKAFISTGAGDRDVVLYDDAGNQLASKSFPGTVGIRTNGGTHCFYFDTPQSLDADTWYRIVFTPTNATSINTYKCTFMDLNQKAASMWRDDGHYTTLDTGVWDDTATDEVPFFDLLIDQIDTGAGAGGGGSGTPRGYVCP